MYEFDIYDTTCTHAEDDVVIVLPDVKPTYCPFCGASDCLEEAGELSTADVSDTLADIDLDTAHRIALEDNQSVTEGDA